jgi:hypothetical protein
MSVGKTVLGLLLVVSLAGGLFVFEELDRGDPNMWSGSGVSSVVVDSDEMAEIEDRYTTEEERAWCLFGEVQENEDGTAKAVVEEVIWDSDAECTKTSVEFNCHRGISSPENGDYIGHVHSHPSGTPAQPSTQDEITGHAGATVMGIYNGEEFSFFAGEEISAALDGDTGVEEIDHEVN